MANDTWNYAGSANWTTAADWSAGVPISTSNVIVAKGNPLVTGAIGIASLTDSATVTFKNAGASSISGFVSNAGKLIFDGNSGQGGSSLAIGGSLTNTGVVRIGAADNSLSASDTVQASSLVNSGKLLLNGGATAEALLNITGAAGFGTAGVLTGGVALSGNAEVEFASGSISKIASHASLTLTGANAFIADSGSLGTNSALSGLTTNLGALDLVNGAQLTTGGALTSLGTLSLESDGVSLSGMTIGGALTTQSSLSPSLTIDAADGEGGSSLTVDGALKYAGIVELGNSSLSQSSTVNATGLVAVKTTVSGGSSSYGTLILSSDTTTAAQMLLQVSGAAGFGTAGVLSSDVSLSGDSAIVFGSGKISSIGANGQLAIDGPLVYIADASAPSSNSALSGLTSVAGSLSLGDGASIATAGALSIGGTVNVDSGYFYYTSRILTFQGGSSLTIGGALTVNGSSPTGVPMGVLNIGNAGMTDSDTLTASSLSNQGQITVAGDPLAGIGGLLDITSAAGFGSTGILTGNVTVSSGGTIEFASGRITSIAAGAKLTLDGPSAFVADAGSLTSNSALAGLATIAGTFALDDGASFTRSGALTVSGSVDLDSSSSYGGGSSLTKTGELINNGAVNIGSATMAQADTVTVDSLANAGTITIVGGASTSAEALLKVTGAAGFGTTGVLAGTVSVAGVGAVQFGSGQIASIASGASLTLNGPGAHIAQAASPTANSALTGLTSVAGTFALDNGAADSKSGALAVSGAFNLDYVGTYSYGSSYLGGSTLTVTGALTNSGALNVGSSSITKTDTIKAGSLINSGTINLAGGATTSAEALLNIGGAAGFGAAGVLSGSVNISGAGIVEFASGEVASIASGSSLVLNGPTAFVADAGSLTSNSALTGLTGVAGALAFDSGASLTTTGALTNTGTIALDIYVTGQTSYGSFLGGSSLSVGGALTNNGTLEMGGSSLLSADTLATTSLTNSGIIDLNGHALIAGPLINNNPNPFPGTNGNVYATDVGNIVEAAVTGNGSFYLESGSSLEFDSSVGGTQSVNFNNYGAGVDSLILGTNAATAFGGTINDFSFNDSIDLLGFGTGTTASYADNGFGTAGTLTLTNGAHVANIAFSGGYSTGSFGLTSTATDTMVKFV